MECALLLVKRKYGQTNYKIISRLDKSGSYWVTVLVHLTTMIILQKLQGKMIHELQQMLKNKKGKCWKKNYKKKQ